MGKVLHRDILHLGGHLKQHIFCFHLGLLGNKINSFNNIFIANWDDTLFCTSYLTPEGFFSDKLKTNEKVIKFMQKLEFSLVRLLSLAMANGCDVYIISNYVGKIIIK